MIVLSSLKVAKLFLYPSLQESDMVAGRCVLPWNACLSATNLIGLPSCRPPLAVISLALTSAILIPMVTDSDPLFRQTNRENGQLPLVCPTSFRKASANLFWLNEAVITLAITQLSLIASIIWSGPCPAPSMPYPPLSWITLPCDVIIHGPLAAIGM